MARPFLDEGPESAEGFLTVRAGCCRLRGLEAGGRLNIRESGHCGVVGSRSEEEPGEAENRSSAGCRGVSGRLGCGEGSGWQQRPRWQESCGGRGLARPRRPGRRGRLCHGSDGLIF